MDSVTSREVDNLQSETMAGVNFRFEVATEEEILQMLTILECVVLLPSLCTLLQLFSSILCHYSPRFWRTIVKCFSN